MPTDSFSQVTDSSRHTPSPSPNPPPGNSNLNVFAAALQSQMPLGSLFLQNQLSLGLNLSPSDLTTTIQAAIQQQASFQQQLQHYMLMQQSGNAVNTNNQIANLIMQTQVSVTFFLKFSEPPSSFVHFLCKLNQGYDGPRSIQVGPKIDSHITFCCTIFTCLISFCRYNIWQRNSCSHYKNNK